MFKFIIVALALGVAALAAPAPEPEPSSLAYGAPYGAGVAYVKPVAAVDSSRAYVPATYSSAYVAPVAAYGSYPYRLY